jgi:hypothetical protein
LTRIIQINTAANPVQIAVNDDVTGGGATVYANRAAFPAPPASGVGTTQLFAIANDTGILYCSFGGSWCEMLILSP